MKKMDYGDMEKKKFNGNILIITVGVLAIIISGFLYASTLQNPDVPDITSQFNITEMG